MAVAANSIAPSRRGRSPSPASRPAGFRSFAAGDLFADGVDSVAGCV